jgi:hypothetical protein
VTPWLDDVGAEGWFPEDSELVPNLTSLIATAAIAVVAVLVAVVVGPTKRSLEVHRLTQRATQSMAHHRGEWARAMRRIGLLHVTNGRRFRRVPNEMLHAEVFNRRSGDI